jgi:hypothetical protein
VRSEKMIKGMTEEDEGPFFGVEFAACFFMHFLPCKGENPFSPFS